MKSNELIQFFDGGIEPELEQLGGKGASLVSMTAPACRFHQGLWSRALCSMSSWQLTTSTNGYGKPSRV